LGAALVVISGGEVATPERDIRREGPLGRKRFSLELPNCRRIRGIVKEGLVPVVEFEEWGRSLAKRNLHAISRGSFGCRGPGGRKAVLSGSKGMTCMP